MILRAYLFLVFVVLSSSFSYSQLTINEAVFSSQSVLSTIFHGEFQEETNLQKWPVSSVQALEMDTYLDAKHFAYTSVDTIINFQLDTNQYKIVVFTTFQVDSIGRIQEYMFSQIQILTSSSLILMYQTLPMDRVQNHELKKLAFLNLH